MPQDGSQYVDIGNQSNFTLSQVFSVAIAGQYVLWWYDASHVDAPTSPYSFCVLDGALNEILCVGVESLNAAGGGTWYQREFLLDLDAGNYTVAFTAEGVVDGYDTKLDNVNVVPLPEPSLVLSLSFGMAALAQFYWLSRTPG